MHLHGITFNAAGLSNKTKERYEIPLDKKANVDAYVVNGEIVHCFQRLLGLSAEGDMIVIPFRYGPDWAEPVHRIDRIINHTIGKVQRLLKYYNIN